MGGGGGKGNKCPSNIFFCLRIYILATVLNRVNKKNWMRIGSGNSDNVIFDNDSDFPTSSCKQLHPSAVVVTSDSETSAEEEESNESESSDDKTIYEWCKTDKSQAASLS